MSIKQAQDIQFGEIIYRYTREQAFEDGLLIDISQTAAEAGFRIPVAMTLAAWADCVEWTEETDRRKAVHQDESGRLWDVVYMARRCAATNRASSIARFQLFRVPVKGRGNRPRLTALQLHIGAGDNGEAVITISLPGED